MKILIALGDSCHSDRAVDCVTQLSWPAGSRVIVAAVVDPAAGIPVQEAAAIRARDRLRAAGISTEHRVIVGDAREQLLSLIETERADLVVVAPRGRKGAHRLLLGDLSSQLVTHAGCAVLVIKAAPVVVPTGSNGEIWIWRGPLSVFVKLRT